MCPTMFTTLFLLAGCAFLTPDGDAVRVVRNANAVAACASLGEVKAVLACLLLLVPGCAGSTDLKPGQPTGRGKGGLEQTSERLALTVHGLSLEDLWAATLWGVRAVVGSGAHVRIVDQEPTQFVKIEGMNVLDSEIVSYTRICLVSLSGAIQVQVTKLYKMRRALIRYGPAEADYLGAIQRELTPR